MTGFWLIFYLALMLTASKVSGEWVSLARDWWFQRMRARQLAAAREHELALLASQDTQIKLLMTDRAMAEQLRDKITVALRVERTKDQVPLLEAVSHVSDAKSVRTRRRKKT